MTGLINHTHTSGLGYNQGDPGMEVRPLCKSGSDAEIRNKRLDGEWLGNKAAMHGHPD